TWPRRTLPWSRDSCRRSLRDRSESALVPPMASRIRGHGHRSDLCIVAAMGEAVIVGGARTAIGRLLGSLSDFSGAEFGGIAIKAALGRAGISGDQVDYVIMGQVLQAGAGQITSRQAAVAAGIPMTVPSLTINKVCLSGLDAIALAAQLIRAGEFEVVVA